MASELDTLARVTAGNSLSLTTEIQEEKRWNQIMKFWDEHKNQAGMIGAVIGVLVAIIVVYMAVLPVISPIVLQPPVGNSVYNASNLTGGAFILSQQLPLFIVLGIVITILVGMVLVHG